MKRYIYILFAVIISFISCNKSEIEGGEILTLDYKVIMPYAITKSETIGDASHIDQVVCAVFDNGTEICTQRRVFQRNADGTFPNYQPSLYLGKEYQIVFWAHKEGKYDVSNMSGITYGIGGYATNDETMDAFTLTQTVKINKDKTITVGTAENAHTLPTSNMTAILKRPFAKLSVGTLASDWTSDVNITHSRITLSVVMTHFDAVTGKVVEEVYCENQKYSAPIINQSFKVTKDGVETEYKYVSLNYLFPGSVANVTIELANKDFGADDFDPDTDIIMQITEDNVPVNSNIQTNMTGNILKGELDLTVEVDPTFDEN